MKNYLYFSAFLLFFLLVFTLKDLHAQWVPVPINSQHSIGNVASLKVLENRIYAGTDYDIFLSVNNGNLWAALSSGLKYVNCFAVSWSGSNPNIFAASFGNIYISSNYGGSWSATNSTWAPYDDIQALAASGSNLFAANNIGVFVSDNNGNIWLRADGLDNSYVRSFTVLGSVLFAGTDDNGLYVSADNGKSWSKSSDFPNSSVFSLAVSGSNIFAGTISDGIFLSTDSGKTWSAVNDETTKYIVALEVYGSNIFAASDQGVFLSTDNGTHWVNTDIDMHPIYSLAVSGSYIFAGGNSGQVYKRPLSELVELVTDIKASSNTLPSEFYLGQNYPNPFNPSTKISWQSPVVGHQTLKVYDILGNEVATLVNEYKPAGRYEIIFDGSNLSSGVYYYQLKAGNFVETKKLVIIR